MLFQAAFDFRTFLSYLQEVGAIDIFLPFILVFAIVFAVLEKTKVLGEKSNINVVVAFVIGVLLVAQPSVVAIINQFLPNVSLILVVALMLLLVLSMIAGKEFGGLGGWGMVIGAILTIGAIVVALNPNFDFLSAYDRSNLLQWAVGIGALLFAGWFITRDTSGKGGSSAKSLGDAFENLIKPRGK